MFRLLWFWPMVAATSGTGSSDCSAVLFTYFGGTGGETAKFALSADSRHFVELNGGNPISDLAPANGTSIRDPFLRRSPLDGRYYLVSTNGAGFGGTDTILMWSSANLVDWSAQAVLPVMANFAEDMSRLWAPEWVFDEERQEYLVFWATHWKEGRGHFGSECDNPELGRFTFCGAYTKDWDTFSDAFPLYDPACKKAWFAPDAYGDGGIDGDIARGPDGRYYLFYKDSRAPNSTGVGPMQQTSGTRVAWTANLSDPGAWSPPGNGALLGPWGTEGPELLRVNGSLRM
jgi:hypothetical protein